MDLGIAGRVALVTASSKGLGLSSAVALAEAGCKVVICARGEEALDAATSRIGETGAEVLAVVADVTEADAPAHLVATTVDHFGSCDIVVANAGGPPGARALELTDEAVLAALEANFLTSMRLVREALPHMQGWGRIACITSSSIKEPILGLAASNLSRTALWSWAVAAAKDLAATGVTLNLVCPGLHDTERIRAFGISPDTRMGDPDDFGRAVAFLCSQPAAFITGTTLLIDGGAHVSLT